MPLLLSGLLGLLMKLSPVTGVLSSIPGIFDSFIDSIKRHWQVYLIGLLLAISAGSSYEWRHTAAALKTEKAAHAADIKAYKDAQAAAEKKAQAEKAAITKTAKDEASEADSNYTTLIAHYRANLVRYKTLKRTAKRSGGGQSSDPSQEPDGPSSGAVVPASPVTISSDDADICAVNTARLQAAHDWALSLTKEVTPDANVSTPNQ